MAAVQCSVVVYEYECASECSSQTDEKFCSMDSDVFPLWRRNPAFPDSVLSFTRIDNIICTIFNTGVIHSPVVQPQSSGAAVVQPQPIRRLDLSRVVQMPQHGHKTNLDLFFLTCGMCGVLYQALAKCQRCLGIGLGGKGIAGGKTDMVDQ